MNALDKDRLEDLDSSLDRMDTIAKRQPLPTQLFFNEARDIIRAAMVVAYEAGKDEATPKKGRQSKKDLFPLDRYTD